MICSPMMSTYFDELQSGVTKANDIATAARGKGHDPDVKVEAYLAKDMADRVVGIISTLAPQIVGAGVVERIADLEREYGALDWRVAMKIAEELAQQKYCKFKDQHEAMDIGIRTGLAYMTVGVLSSPLDGIIGIEFKDRIDKTGKFLCINYGGPIRNAGGTMAAISVLIADYVRKKMGYAAYDPTSDEVKRAYTEMQDYHERVTNLQYNPSVAEAEFLASHLPVEVSGDASEDIEVSNYKDLPRIPINRIRSGYCLILSSCLALKAPKMWKQLSKWGSSFDMDHWNFLEEFLAIQKKAKSHGASQKSATLTPDFTFIHDLVAGRPVLAHPLRVGGFRLRYGRGRNTGFSTCGLHPATMLLTENYIGVGTQLKHERPSKGCVIGACDTIEGPIVLLENGSVLQLRTAEEAKRYASQVKSILFLGDYLVSYGDFLNRAHPLVPAGYCEEWWVQEFERAIVERFGVLDLAKTADLTGVAESTIRGILSQPLLAMPTVDEAISFVVTGVPLHPRYTYYWSTITPAQLLGLVTWLSHADIIRTSSQAITSLILPLSPAKEVLELLGISHTIERESVVVGQVEAIALLASVGLPSHSVEEVLSEVSTSMNVLATLCSLSGFTIRDKAGTFIGARMGRPEKAKMRKMTGSPHGLFPVGEEGGKFKSLQGALEKQQITAEYPRFECATCKRKIIYLKCDHCGDSGIQHFYCKECGWLKDKRCTHERCQNYGPDTLPVKDLFQVVLSRLGWKAYPDLIKGIKGTSSKEHRPEHLAKAMLRAKHNIYVNKDGTIRYDMTQMPLTHFRPCEIRTSVQRLRALGYVLDINGKSLENENQICELKPQDVVLPCCEVSPDEPADSVLLRVTQFVDETLNSLYDLSRFYNCQTSEDLTGHLVVALAPHTSAGIVGRIIGFSHTQGFLAHPLLHAATRRDCDGDEASVSLLMDVFLNFSKKFLPDTRGGTMDAPLVLTTILVPSEVDDGVFDVDTASHYPLQLYELGLALKSASEVSVGTIKGRLGKPDQYEGMGFTHDTANLNSGVLCSAYKTLPSMAEKLAGQMVIAGKIRAVDTADVARLVIEKHFIKDAKGNLRKFSTQEFRCVACNEKYRRPPLIGKCVKCKGRVIFTVTEGNVVKYIEATFQLAEKYNLSPYLKQTIQLLKSNVESVFGREKETQMGLGKWA